MLRLANNKKGLVLDEIIKITLISVALILIIGVIIFFFGKAEGATAESICRGSVAAREVAKIQIAGGFLEQQMAPFLCKTLDKKIEAESKEAAKKQIAELMARTWWMFGEGHAREPIEGSFGFKNNCMIAYNLDVKKTKGFTEKITTQELLLYLMNTPYKVSVTDVELDCNNKLDDDQDGKCDTNGCGTMPKDEDCQVKRTNQCLLNGGVCQQQPQPGCLSGTKAYSGWLCGRSQSCCVTEKSFLTYNNYIQNTNGVVVILSDIEPGKNYAVLFGSPTKSCNWCKWVIGGAIVTGVVIATVGTGGAALAVGASVILVGTAGTAATKIALIDVLSNRLRQTIYIMEMDPKLSSVCNLVQD